MNKTVLVTGGAGYVGSHTCKALAQAGYTPVSYDNLSRGFRELVKWGPLVIGDISDNEALAAAIKNYNPDAVLHFAAYAYVGESMVEPVRYWRNNFTGTLCLLNEIKKQGVNKLVFSSTCSIYGDPQQLPLDESHPRHPINPYAKTKLAIEDMLLDFAHAYEMEIVALRYFNAAGADPDGEIGECHDPETHLIPLILQVAAGNRDEIEIFGDSYPTADGTCIRDYIHVTDLADAHVRSLDYLYRGGNSTSFNLGTGSGYSVAQIIEVVKRVTGQAIKEKTVSPRAGDPHTLISASGLAKEQLGWSTDYSDIETIVATAWKWHSTRCNSQ